MVSLPGEPGRGNLSREAATHGRDGAEAPQEEKGWTTNPI
jgi:hypothetical protein